MGSALLFQYTMASPFLFFFWGDDGWMPRETAMTLVTDPWMLSVFFYFKSPWQWIAFHTLFLCALTAFVSGGAPACSNGSCSSGIFPMTIAILRSPYGASEHCHLSDPGSLPGPGRTRHQPRSRARGAGRETQGPQRHAAALHQSLGQCLHAAHPAADGGAVFLQRDLQGSAATTGGAAMRCGSPSPSTNLYNPVVVFGLFAHTILAGHRRDLRRHPDRDRLRVPDLAASARGRTCSPQPSSCISASRSGCRSSISPTS